MRLASRSLPLLLALGLAACQASDAPPIPLTTAPTAVMAEALAATAVPSATPRPQPTPVPSATPRPTVIVRPSPAPVALAPPPQTVAGGQSAGDPATPELGNTGYDVDRYTLRLRLDPSAKRLAGSATIDAAATVDHLGQVSFDFADGRAVGGVTVDGSTVPWQYARNKLVVNLPRPYARGEGFHVTIDYSGPLHGIPTEYVPFASVGMAVTDNGAVMVSSEPDGARAWFPANDHPRDKARFRFEITVPPPLVVAATGVLRDTHSTPDGTLYVWEMDQPMATYLAGVLAGPYERVDGRSPGGIKLRHYAAQGFAADFAATVAVAGPALDWMVAHFGPYPFDEFGYSLVWSAKEAMENQSNVILGSSYLTENAMIHEMAHMWFGDSVSLDSWADIWRNEGFATYVETLWRRRDGDETGLARDMGILESQIAHHPTDYPLGSPPPSAMFDTPSYNKGAWLAHMLRRRVGDDAFYRGLRTYFERYRGRAASRAQFEAVFNEVSGQDLRPFFAYWLDQPDIPDLRVTWADTAVDGRHAIDVQVCVDHAPPYPASVDVVARGEGSEQTVSAPLSSGQRVHLDLSVSPSTLEIDPHQTLLNTSDIKQVAVLTPCPQALQP